jgi:uncharacterized protein YjbI with pentapeptide repeats
VWGTLCSFEIEPNLKGADFSPDKAQTPWWQALGNVVSLGNGIAGYGGTFVYHNSQMTNLTGATFVKADLGQALLKGVQLTAADFRQALLIKTLLEGSDLRNTNFSEADLSQANLRSSFLGKWHSRPREPNFDSSNQY